MRARFPIECTEPQKLLSASFFRMEEWAENILGELQNGFRRDRRIDDNLFITTQCTEVARLSKKPLWVAFLDIKGAYDYASQEKLWVQLREFDLDAHLITLLQQVYTNNEVVITWEAEVTEPAEIKRGLRQGCPLSPLLSMIYLSRIEKKLVQVRF